MSSSEPLLAKDSPATGGSGSTGPQAEPARVSDAELMSQVAQGEEAALGELYDRYSGHLYGLCLKILRRPAEAQAVLSDVFYEIWRRADRFNPERGRVRTYFTTLARSRSIDRIRSESTRSTHEAEYSAEAGRLASGPSPVKGPQQTAVENETMSFVHEVLHSLGEDQRACLEAAYFEGLTQQQIADHLQLPLGTVKTHIRTGLEKLRSAVAAHEAGTLRE
ncbi:MAG: sigma-70 family RNA polymerase sigma factor [Lacipirellulaceae bacterium]